VPLLTSLKLDIVLDHQKFT